MGNLSELIKLSGMKQAAIARALKVSQPVVSYWANEKQPMTIENAIALAKFFNVSVGCIVGTEPIPEGYPDLTYFPVSHEQAIKDQQQAAAEGRIMNPEFLPAYRIGNNPSEQPAKRKKAPFTREQEEYLEEMEDRIVSKMTAALREDTSSSSEEDAQ